MRGIKAARLAMLASLSLACCASALIAPTAEAAEGPTNTSPPSISGVAQDGLSLKVGQGLLERGEADRLRLSVVALRRRRELLRADRTRQKSLLQGRPQDVGHTLRVAVSASNSEGQTSETSQPSDLVAPAPLVKRKNPAISGSPRDGQLLTVGNGHGKAPRPSHTHTNGSPAPKAASARTFPTQPRPATAQRPPRSGTNCELSSRPPMPSAKRAPNLNPAS